MATDRCIRSFSSAAVNNSSSEGAASMVRRACIIGSIGWKSRDQRPLNAGSARIICGRMASAYICGGQLPQYSSSTE